MRYNKIRKMDIANGEGVRVSIFFQGCAFHCKKCCNPETWDFDGGEEFGDEQIDQIIELAKPNHIAGLSILGGEPMHPKNIEGTTELAKAFKARFPQKDLWIWSGYNFDKDLKDKEVVKYADVIVDGRFIEESKNPTLKWRGSSNQRIINVPETLKTNQITLRML